MVDNRLQPLAVIRVEVNRDGYRQLRRFAGRWSHAVWAIVGATGLGAVLTARLATDGIDVVDVAVQVSDRWHIRELGYTGSANLLVRYPPPGPRGRDTQTTVATPAGLVDDGWTVDFASSGGVLQLLDKHSAMSQRRVPSPARTPSSGPRLNLQ